MTGKVKAMAMDLEEMSDKDWAKYCDEMSQRAYIPELDDELEYGYDNPLTDYEVAKFVHKIDNPPVIVTMEEQRAGFANSLATGIDRKVLEQVTLKWDSDKEPLAWIPAECMQGIAKVLAYGAEKYEKDNWRRGIPMSRYISAALRHINAWNSGEDLDPESGMSHIDHAMCGLMFVQWYIKHRPEYDDRYKDDKGTYLAEITPKQGFNGA